jgi:acyl carrier protein
MDEKLVIQCVELQLGRKGVKIEDRFFEDLGIESIEMIYILAAIESTTGLFIPEEMIPEIKTVLDLNDYICFHLPK